MSSRGPGVVKVRTIPTLRTREVSLVSLTEGLVRDWLDGSDVMSEGAAVSDGAYFGTTSIVIAITDARRHEIESALVVDPHMRVRALRIAVREARGRGADGTLYAEFSIVRNARGIVVTIDIESRRAAPPTSSPLTRTRSC